MVKLIFGGVPLEDAEVLAVVLGMASRTIVVVLGTVNHASMHALVRSHQLENLAVAVQALELFPPRAERVTAGTLERTIQRAMGSRQRARAKPALAETCRRKTRHRTIPGDTGS